MRMMELKKVLTRAMTTLIFNLNAPDGINEASLIKEASFITDARETLLCLLRFKVHQYYR